MGYFHRYWRDGYGLVSSGVSAVQNAFATGYNQRRQTGAGPFSAIVLTLVAPHQCLRDAFGKSEPQLEDTIPSIAGRQRASQDGEKVGRLEEKVGNL